MSNEDRDRGAEQLVRRVRRLTLASGLFTILGVGAVLSVISYRVWHAGQNEEPATPSAPVDVAVALPSGARVVGTDVTDERIVVTIEVGGRTEIRIYDIETLEQVGRLALTPGP